jgi:hypothetical protein
LSKQFDLSYKQIRQLLDECDVQFREIEKTECVLLMDTTYFGRGFGVMVFRDHTHRRNLLRCYVTYETVEQYKQGFIYLQSKGVKVLGIVCDGKRGMYSAFGNIPIQMCHYHQVAIITKYITRNPKLQAGIELKEVVKKLTTSTKIEFIDLLDQWQVKWKDFLVEKTFNNECKKWHYTHKKLRSAHRSLRTNLPYLFTYLGYPDLGIPNKTNPLEGIFTNLKTKLRNHAGTTKQRKMKIIDEILSK